MEHLSNRQAIETLEYVHGLLDRDKEEEMRRSLQAIIRIFAENQIIAKQLDHAPRQSLPYIPPAL